MTHYTFASKFDCSISEYNEEIAFVKKGHSRTITASGSFHVFEIIALIPEQRNNSLLPLL